MHVGKIRPNDQFPKTSLEIEIHTWLSFNIKDICSPYTKEHCIALTVFTIKALQPAGLSTSCKGESSIDNRSFSKSHSSAFK